MKTIAQLITFIKAHGFEARATEDGKIVGFMIYCKNASGSETSSGDYSKLAASGDYSNLAASGKKSIAVASGVDSQASAGEDGCIALAWWDKKAERYRMEVAYVGEDGIEPNVTYKLDDNHKFVKA